MNQDEQQQTTRKSIYCVNPNPGARNRVNNNMVATPGFDPRTYGTPEKNHHLWAHQAHELAGQATVCRCPASVLVRIYRCSRDDAIALDVFSQ